MKTILRIEELAPDKSGYPLSLYVDDGTQHWAESPIVTAVLDRTRLKAIKLDVNAVSTAGKQLHDVLLDSAVGRALKEVVDKTGLNGGCTAYLEITPAEVRALPWESMVGVDRRHLFLQEGMVWARGAAHGVTALPLNWPLQVFVVVSDPADRRLLAEDEIDAMTCAVRNRWGEWLIEVQYGPTSESLAAALQRLQPDVVHLIGHATLDADGMGALDIRPPGGRIWRLTPDRILNTSALQAHPPRLVVINGCRTADAVGAVYALSRAYEELGATSVVSMQADLPSAAAVTFTRALYADLADGISVGEAVRSARRIVYQTEPDVPWLWAVPALVTQNASDALARAQAPIDRIRAGRCYPDVSTMTDRTDEQRQIWSMLDDRHPQASILLVTGSPEVGKSALVQSCLHVAQIRGADACYASLQRGAPRALWLDVLRVVREAVKASLPHADEACERFDHSLAQLIKGVDPVAPEGRQLLKDPGTAWNPHIERETTMRRGVFAAFRRMLGDVARSDLVLAIDHIGQARDVDVIDHLVPDLLLPIVQQQVPGVRLLLVDTIENLGRLLPADVLRFASHVQVQPLPRTERIYREYGVRKGLDFSGAWKELVEVITSHQRRTELFPNELGIVASLVELV